ncbi:MAG: biopolymer transporter ExbD [Pirellulaceae bacterium]
MQQGRVLAALSMTPLIDVVFLLLIFFLVASRLSQEDRELDIPLPSAANAMPMTTEPQEMVVNIDENGQIFINNESDEPGGFETVLTQSIANNPLGQSVIIRGHRQVDFQAAIDVMDVCLKCGATYSASIADENET